MNDRINRTSFPRSTQAVDVTPPASVGMRRICRLVCIPTEDRGNEVELDGHPLRRCRAERENHGHAANYFRGYSAFFFVKTFTGKHLGCLPLPFNVKLTGRYVRHTEACMRHTEACTRYTEASTRRTEASTRSTEASTRHTEASTRHTEWRSKLQKLSSNLRMKEHPLRVLGGRGVAL